jgi:hypothetical protein
MSVSVARVDAPRPQVKISAGGLRALAPICVGICERADRNTPRSSVPYPNYPLKSPHLGLSLAALLVCALCSNTARSQVLLFDNFNANTPNTNDLNVDLARQTGSLAPVSYTMAFGPGHYGHQLQNGNAINQLLVADFPNSTSSLNRNFNLALSAGGLRIGFDVDSLPAVYGSNDDSNWGALNIGMSAANQLVNVNGGEAHFGVLFRRNGQIQAFDGSAVVDNGSIYSSIVGPVYRHVEIAFSDADGNPFDGIGDTTIKVFGDVNNFSAPIFTYIKAGGYADNFINLQGSFRAHVDNLTVQQVPEPGSVAFIGLGLAAFCARRRR